MRLEHYPIEKLKREIIEILRKYSGDLKGSRVFFFGSRIEGSGTDRSDIDIGIEGTNPIPSIVMRKIKEEIRQIPLLYQIDVVDFKSTSKDFRGIASKYTELIVSL